MLGTWAKTFALLLVWDWLGTASMRLVANGSDLAPLFGGILTTFLWLAIGLAKDRILVFPAVGGAILGTWLGMRLP